MCLPFNLPGAGLQGAWNETARGGGGKRKGEGARGERGSRAGEGNGGKRQREPRESISTGFHPSAGGLAGRQLPQQRARWIRSTRWGPIQGREGRARGRGGFPTRRPRRRGRHRHVSGPRRPRGRSPRTMGRRVCGEGRPRTRGRTRKKKGERPRREGGIFIQSLRALRQARQEEYPVGTSHESLDTRH